ncbi:MAG: hypothetical protein AB8B97_18940 [Granulosicoccus sp.]
MGKKYNSQIDDDYLDDLFEDDMDLDVDFEESMELFMDRQGSANPSRHAKGSRGRKKTTEDDYHSSENRLPGDWQDFDYTSESSLGDDWR